MTCNAACGGDGDCAPGKTCNAGSCGMKALGQLCGAASDCESNNCVEGVCCSSPSCGTCQSCAVTGLAGTCRPVPAGDVEPHGGCTGTTPCGFIGTCDGNGACRQAPTSTSCGVASCSGATYTAIGHCDGNGACDQTATSTCAPYKCGPAACLTVCAADADCAAGLFCRSGSCTAKPNGDACVAGAECTSGSCVEGVCCGSASCPSCSSCAVAGKAGTCQPVPANGLDPAAVCVTTGSTTCGMSGRCNGSGQCAFHPAGTPCGAQSCMAAAIYAPVCNGSGACAPAMIRGCAPYACSGTECGTSCANQNDCAPMHKCTNGACEPNGTTAMRDAGATSL